jgi:hypothetical protein
MGVERMDLYQAVHFTLTTSAGRMFRGIIRIAVGVEVVQWLWGGGAVLE